METKKPFPYGKTFVLGFGYFGISLIGPIFNTYIPIFLKENFLLSATLVGFVMTWDNYINIFVQPVIGERSDRLRTRIGRRKPFIFVGAPLAALFFILIPLMGTIPAIMVAILLTNLSMAIFRAPTISLLGDLFAPEDRSKANGIINFMGGLAAVLAYFVGGVLYKMGKITPFVFASVVMLAAVTLVILLVKEPEAPPSPPKEQKSGLAHNLREVLQSADRSGLLILLAILCWFIGFNTIETWISSFGKFTLGINAGMMSILTSGLALMFLLFAIPSGLIATRYGRKPVIMVGIAGLVLLTIYGLVIGNQIMLIGFLVPAGICWALINVNSLPMVYDIGGDARIGAFTGLYYVASNIAAVAGPQFAGFLIDMTGGNYRVVFLFSAIFFILAGIFMLRVHEQRAGMAARLAGQA